MLRKVRPVRPEGGEPAARGVEVALLLTRRGPGDDLYLASLARLYADLTRGHEPNPNKRIAEIIGRALPTAKAQIGEARRRGFLTVQPHRAGGERTERARELLNGA